MGGYNSGTFDETSPIGKDWVNLECGVARVFVKAGRTPGKAILKWKILDGVAATPGRARSPSAPSGEIVLELKPFAVNNGISAAPQQEYPANRCTFGRKTNAEAVQDLGVAAAGAVPYKVFVNGTEVKFGPGKPVKPDDNTGVCCAYSPVLAALKAAGAQFEYSEDPKKIPANKKWLRDMSPTPYRAIVTVKAGGREIDACVGFTELFLDNGKDKNLTNCEIYGEGKKNSVVCGELSALVGYIPGIEMKTDANQKVVELTVKK